MLSKYGKFFEVIILKYQNIIKLFWISLPICVLLRTIQLLFTIDASTGFIKHQYSEIAVLITFVVCAAVATLSALSAATDDVKYRQKQFKPTIAAAGILMSGMHFYEAIASLGQSVNRYGIILVFLNLLSAFIFAAYSIKNVYNYRFPTITLVIPTSYYVIKLINLFISTSALALVVENIFLLFTNSAILFFVFEFACFENEIGDISKKSKKLFSSGILAAMMCAVTALPKLIITICGAYDASSNDIASLVLMITTAIFIMTYISGNFHVKDSSKSKEISKHSM